MESNLLPSPGKEKSEISFFYTSRPFSKTINLYAGANRSRAVLFATCHYQVVQKTIELRFSCGTSEKIIVFEPHKERSGIAGFLSPCHYLGTCRLDNSLEVSFKVSGLEPYIQAQYDHDEMILSSAAPACPADVKYTVHSRKYGTLIYLYPENIFTLKEIIASRAGLERIALGTMETPRAQYLEMRKDEVDDILSAILFIYQVVFQTIRPDSCDVSS